MIGSEGISFPAARTRVIDTLNAEIYTEMEAHAAAEKRKNLNGVIPFGQAFIPSAIFCGILALTVALSEHRRHFMVGVISSIGTIMAVCVATVYACRHYRENVRSEVIDEIKRLVCDYLDELDSIPAEQLQRERDPRGEGAVLSGNPHVDIVTVYRNMQWQRVPSLLLVEGDIVALMGGDIAPGEVQELLPLEDHGHPVPANAGAHADHDLPSEEGAAHRWRKLSNKVIRKGDKIRLRKGAKSSGVGSRRSGSGVRSKMSIYGRRGRGGGAASSDKQRVVSSNSLELLHFSGDIRCFLLCETPIASFCRDLLAKDMDLMQQGVGHTSALEIDMKDILPTCMWALCGITSAPLDDSARGQGESSAGARVSFMRALLRVVTAKGKAILRWLIFLLLVSTLLRFIFLPETRQQWGQVLLIPITTVAMCFFPLSLPIGLIAAEILTTASLLTSIESSLKRDPVGYDSKAGGSQQGAEAEAGMGTGTGGSGSANAVNNTASNDSYDPLLSSERPGGGGGTSTSAGGQTAGQSPRGSDEDEYKDEDIDDRFVVTCICYQLYDLLAD
jgi:hypothetical protein